MRGTKRLAALLAALAALAPWALAADPAPPPTDVGESAMIEGFVERAPAILMLSLQGGLPAYRSASVGAALKAEGFGVALSGGWGSVGGAFGAQVRWYPPLPGLVPLYLGVGADAYAGNVTPHGVIGAHVPLGPAWRLELAGGVASATLAGERVWAPHVSVGVAYAISLDLEEDPAATVDGDAAAGAPLVGGSARTRCEPGPPDPWLIDAAVAREVRAFVRDAVALYGNAYRDLRYRYGIVRRSVDGVRADVTVRYDGSARAVLDGGLVEASGEATASFVWTGCGWRLSDLRY